MASFKTYYGGKRIFGNVDDEIYKKIDLEKNDDYELLDEPEIKGSDEPIIFTGSNESHFQVENDVIDIYDFSENDDKYDEKEIENDDKYDNGEDEIDIYDFSRSNDDIIEGSSEVHRSLIDRIKKIKSKKGQKSN